MTKRFGNFTDNNTKKLKVENLEDLWGDDLDIKDVDDCFQLATQAWQQENFSCTQRNNVSILPPYNVFKKETSKNRFTSTQSDPALKTSLHIPSTSKTPITNGIQKTLLSSIKNGDLQDNGFKRTRSFDSPEQSAHLEPKFKRLQEQYVAKEGEVSILRTQLKEIRTNKDNEQNKKQKEWSDKLTTVTKQLNSAKSELEFKNLEIANLRQKVVEVAKLNNLDMSLNCTQSPFFKQLRVPEKYANSPDAIASGSSSRREICFKKGFKIQPVVETEHPLQDAVPASVFTFPRKEKYLVDIKNKHMCRNTIPFLQNQMSQELIQRIIRLQPKHTVLDDNRQLNIDYIYCEISKLIKCNVQEIESEENNACVNKMLCVSEQLISNLYQFLQELEQNTPAENSQKIMYLKNKFECLDLDQSLFDTKEWCSNEMGISAKQSIMCISEILPYNSYLRGYLLQNKPLIFKDDEEFLKYLPTIRTKVKEGYSNNNNFNYLKLLSSVVTIIGRLKKSDNFPGFLSATTVLLNKICLFFKIDEMHPILHDITREMVFCHPNIQVLFHFTEFLKNASLQNVFVNKLCKMPAINVLKVNQKEKLLYYNQDTCVLQVLCILLENSILRGKSFKMLELFLNIMKFISNSIKCNPQWMFYQEDKHCDCLCKIVKLFVDVMYQTIEKFHKDRTIFSDELAKHSKILKSGLRILHILNFKVYDLIVKYVATYSQYKDVVKSLLGFKSILNLTESDVELLEYLNITEEIPSADHRMFSTISLWN